MNYAIEFKLIISIIGGLLGLVNFLFWNRIKAMEKNIERTSIQYDKIRGNYLHRFEELHKILNEMEKNIIKEIYELKIKNNKYNDEKL